MRVDMETLRLLTAWSEQALTCTDQLLKGLYSNQLYRAILVIYSNVPLLTSDIVNMLLDTAEREGKLKRLVLTERKRDKKLALHSAIGTTTQPIVSDTFACFLNLQDIVKELINCCPDSIYRTAYSIDSKKSVMSVLHLAVDATNVKAFEYIINLRSFNLNHNVFDSLHAYIQRAEEEVGKNVCLKPLNIGKFLWASPNGKLLTICM
jgi:hypothetical protein